MSEAKDPMFDRHVKWVYEQLTNSAKIGVGVEAAITKLKESPFASLLKPEIIDEARTQYLRNVGKIARYEPMPSIRDREHETGGWYDGPSESDHIYWPHVKEVLRPNLGKALDDVDAASSKVMASLRPPGEPEINVKGLVLGYVQSGKTTNFISLMAKAADVGYRLIIVLAGMTDNLRRQTQERIDEQLVNDTNGWFKLTTAENDFSIERARANSQNTASIFSSPEHRTIAVVKKNGHVLKALNKFLKGSGAVIKQLPILIIDDESDQASINVSPRAKKEVSQINTQIRTLLRNQKTAYVAYTATPFANILIDPNESEDIYPKDFIHVLPKPDGYFGTESIFGRAQISGEENEENIDGLDMIRTVPLDEVAETKPPSSRDSSAIDAWNPEIPDSLDQAIRWFILASAARRARGQENKHSSMLIHTAVRVKAHEKLKDEVDFYLRKLQSDYSKGLLSESLKNQWEFETAQVSAKSQGCRPLTFAEVDTFLPAVFLDIEVIMDNGLSEERLVYTNDSPKTVIAIGGNTLARGLTLEGLVCSYFVRTATAYDTLLQMGRWFGFRNGYADLPRIWMTEELQNWFQDLALVEADLRQDLARYADEGISPLDFQARIRTHPAMEVTARAKQQDHRPASISFSGQKVQTILFRHKNHQWLHNNIEATRNLVSALHMSQKTETKNPNGTRVFHGVSPELIEDFLNEYTIYENADLGKRDAEMLKKYIHREHESGSISAWDISFYGKSTSDSAGSIDLGLSEQLRLINRSQMVISADPDVANIKTLVGSMDRINSIEVDGATKKELVDEFKNQKGSAESKLLRTYESYVGSDVAHLTIYAIDPHSTTTQAKDFKHKTGDKAGKEIAPRNRRKDLDAVDIVIGIGIFFPTSDDPDIDTEYIRAQDYNPDIETMREMEDAADEVFTPLSAEEEEA